MKPKHAFSRVVALLSLLACTGSTFAQFEQLKKMGRAALGQEEDNKQIAYFKIKGELAETPVNMPPLFGSEPPMSLKGLLERFKEARQDKNVVAVLIDLQNASLGLAQLEELHDALRKFAAVDKPVFMHADSLRTLTYAAATGASHISVVPTGDVCCSVCTARRPISADCWTNSAARRTSSNAATSRPPVSRSCAKSRRNRPSR